ncbi:MAG: HaeIII family restriction endonuclease [Muribaculaceae bacterium]
MDTSNSMKYGKAYEYACILALIQIVQKKRNIEIEENESVNIARNQYSSIEEVMRAEMLLSANAGISAIMDMEPRIEEDGNDKLTVTLQPDNVATNNGDIRDVLVIRRAIEWEIGISVKHNHSALKHSRISPHIDFGKDWMGSPCSVDYFNDINVIFDKIAQAKRDGKRWSDIDDKENDVYVPLLKAFMSEFERLQSKSNVTSKLVQYLIGSNGRDYYKLIHHSNHTTTVIPFNLYGSLNMNAGKQKPRISIPPIEMPDRIIELAFKENSKTTIILTMNKGWSISMRLHNASSMVEMSLKFDIQLQSKPEDLFYLDIEW